MSLSCPRAVTARRGTMPDDKQDLETLDAAISRIMGTLETGKPDSDIRDKLNEELAILVAMRLKISSAL